MTYVTIEKVQRILFVGHLEIMNTHSSVTACYVTRSLLVHLAISPEKSQIITVTNLYAT